MKKGSKTFSQNYLYTQTIQALLIYQVPRLLARTVERLKIFSHIDLG